MSSANPKYAGELERDGGADGFGTRPAGSAQAPQYELFQWKVSVYDADPCALLCLVCGGGG